MLYAYFVSLVKHCYSVSTSTITKKWGEMAEIENAHQAIFCVSLPFILLPVLPRLILSRMHMLSMDSIGEENVSLLLVTSPFPSHGGLEDVFGGREK